MHYKNGREAKEGDQIVGKDTNGKAVGGTLVNLNRQTESCNGNVLSPSALWNLPLVTLSECLHVDDVVAADIQRSDKDRLTKKLVIFGRGYKKPVQSGEGAKAHQHMNSQKHNDIFHDTMVRIGEHAFKFIEQGYDLEGWLVFFESHYPDQFKKYRDIMDELYVLQKKEDDASIAKFKRLCDRLEGAHSWALEKYIGFVKAIGECKAPVAGI